MNEGIIEEESEEESENGGEGGEEERIGEELDEIQLSDMDIGEGEKTKQMDEEEIS